MCAMSHHEVRADLVGDLAEPREVDLARVGRGARDDQLRPVLARERRQRVVVDALVLAAHAVRDDLVLAAREGQRVPVRQVAAVREVHAEDRVARLQRRQVDGHVRLRARVRLDVRVLGAEERLRAVDRERLDLVDELAAAVVALARDSPRRTCSSAPSPAPRAPRARPSSPRRSARCPRSGAAPPPRSSARSRDRRRRGRGREARRRRQAAYGSWRILFSSRRHSTTSCAVLGVAVAVGHPGDVVGDRAEELGPRPVALGDLALDRRPSGTSRRKRTPSSRSQRRAGRRPAAGAGSRGTRAKIPASDAPRVAVVPRHREGVDDVPVDELLQLR